MEVVPCIVIIPIQLYGSGTVYSQYTDTVVWKWYRVYNCIGIMYNCIGIMTIHGTTSIQLYRYNDYTRYHFHTTVSV